MEGSDLMERVSFLNQTQFKCDAEKTFSSQKALIKKLIPNVDIQHVGSTAIPNSLTKGDLDIQVRVSENQFIKAVEALSSIYQINDGSIKTEAFRAFEDDTTIPPLGIQLTIIGTEFDFFWKFRDVFLQNDKYRAEYDELKREYEGKAMDTYREAKNDFLSKIMQTPEYKQISN